MDISNKLTPIKEVITLIRMADTACFISVETADFNRLNIEFYGFDGELDNTWAFSEKEISIDGAIKEVLHLKKAEYEAELREEITKGILEDEEAEAEQSRLDNWFAHWGL